MRNVYIAGAGMTRFGKWMDRNMKSLADEAVHAALDDASVEKPEISAAYVGNAAQGLITGQECVRGQVVLREMGIGGIPVVNVENACASSSTALHLAYQAVAGGFHECALVLGMEKLYSGDKKKTYAAFSAAVDVEFLEQIKEMMKAAEKKSAGEDGGSGKSRSMFMDFYAMAAREHTKRHGTTKEQFAAVAAKNAFHGSLNPKAQYRESKTIDEVLASPVIADPLTRLMCAPIGDGAAALVVVSEEFMQRFRKRGESPRPVRIAASVLRTGRDRAPGDPDPVTEAAKLAYEQAGLGPQDIHVAEVHDATAPAELIIMEELGFCEPGESGRLVEIGMTRIDGKLPMNTSGGLIAKGHPVGATGAAQIVELTEQLRGRCGSRQVLNARVGLAENAGGAVRADPAAVAIHILTT